MLPLYEAPSPPTHRLTFTATTTKTTTTRLPDARTNARLYEAAAAATAVIATTTTAAAAPREILFLQPCEARTRVRGKR